MMPAGEDGLDSVAVVIQDKLVGDAITEAGIVVQPKVRPQIRGGGGMNHASERMREEHIKALIGRHVIRRHGESAMAEARRGTLA